MHRKLLALIFLLCTFVSVNAAQNERVENIRLDLHEDETLFFDQQIRKLQQLRLPWQQEDGLYFKFQKDRNQDVIMTTLVGVSDRRSGMIYPSLNYHIHDDACKILTDISKYLANQSDQRILQVMVADLSIGRSKMYHMPFEHE
jgi:hypothetical protein